MAILLQVIKVLNLHILKDNVITRFFYKQRDPEIIRNFKQPLSNNPGSRPCYLHFFVLKCCQTTNQNKKSSNK